MYENETVPESLRDNGADHSKGIVNSPQGLNNVESPRRKGFGLKKWRRIKRDSPVKDESAPPPPPPPVDDGSSSKLLKRGLTGLVVDPPPFKHVDVSSVEARQSSEGSVGSVNMLHHNNHPGVANGFSPDSGFTFTVGKVSEKSEEHSGSNSVGAKNVVGGGKVVSGSQGRMWSDTIKKSSEEQGKTEKEKPCSSLDSDLRSSDFVFSSGAVHGEKDERFAVENGDREEENGDNGCWEDKDPVADSVRSFAVLQEALSKEVKSFQELSKESILLQSNIDNSTPSGSQLLILKQKVKHLEHKLEEARAALEAKETRIQELEKLKTAEMELEGVFQRKVESEIEHLVLTRSLNSSLHVLKQGKRIHSLSKDPEGRRGNMLGETCKFGFYFLTQLVLLVSILQFLVLRFSPASRLVIPT